MRLTYDPRYNIAYLRFQEKQVEVEAIRISDKLVVDMAPDGTIYGIELLNANEQLGGRTQAGSWLSMKPQGSVLKFRLLSAEGSAGR